MTPTCFRCGRAPGEIPGMVAASRAEPEEWPTPEDYAREDGTYNPATGHFACDACYVAIGMPVGPHGWRAP